MSLRKGFLHLFVGNIGVQIISLGFYPLISRIYTPGEFGIYGVFTSTVLVLGIFSCSQLHQLFPNPKSDADAFSILKTATVFNLLFAVLISIAAEFLFKKIFPFLGWYSHLIGVFVFFYSQNEIFKMWFARFRAYRTSSVVINVNRFFAGGLKVGFPQIGLILSDLIANSITTFYGFYFSLKIGKSWISPSLEEIKTILRKYWKYPTILALGTFSQFFVFELPVFFISRNFSKDIVGNYVMANKLIVQSFWLLTGSLAVIFHNKFIDEKHTSGVNSRSYLKFLALTALGALPIVMVLLNWGGDLMVLFLGDRWGKAGEFVALLAPLALTKLLIGPALSYFMSHEKVLFLGVYRTIQMIVLCCYFFLGTHPEINEFIRNYVWLDFSFDLVLIAFSYFSIRSSNH